MLMPQSKGSNNFGKSDFYCNWKFYPVRYVYWQTATTYKWKYENIGKRQTYYNETFYGTDLVLETQLFCVIFNCSVWMSIIAVTFWVLHNVLDKDISYNWRVKCFMVAWN